MPQRKEHAPMNVNINCPSCCKDDQAQKVTSIVDAESRIGRSINHHENLSTRESTDMSHLAIKLALPPEPKYQSPWGCGSMIIVAILIYILIPGIAGIGVAGYTSPAALIIVLPIVALEIWGLTAFINSKSKEAKRRRRQLAQDQVDYHQAEKVYEKSFYCRRCDIKYIPNTPNIP
jgi:hypothetical protein